MGYDGTVMRTGGLYVDWVMTPGFHQTQTRSSNERGRVRELVP